MVLQIVTKFFDRVTFMLYNIFSKNAYNAYNKRGLLSMSWNPS